MLATISIITTPTADTRGTCLVLQIVDKRYLFGNLHEGLQRAIVQRGTKFTKVSDAFLTGTTEWKNVGGLLGWVLSMSDSNNMAANQIRDRQREAMAYIAQHGEERVNPSMKRTAAQEVTVQPFGVHGGPNLAQMIATARRFVFRKGYPLMVQEAELGQREKASQLPPTWENEQIRVWAMPILPGFSIPPAIEDRNGRKETLKFVVDNMFDSKWRMDDLVETSLREVQLPAVVMVRDPNAKDGRALYGQHVPEDPAARPDIPVLVRKPWPGALITGLPPTQPSDASLCYLVKLPHQRGRFNSKKALALKVRSGPNFGLLTNGQSVLAEDGTTVHPEQVLEPGRAGNGFIVAEIPTVHYIESFIKRPELSDASVLQGIQAVMWILGPGVAEEPRLQDFINQHSEWKHIISSPDHNANYVSFDGAAESLIRHYMIDPHRFDVPKYNNEARSLPSTLSHCQLADRDMQIRLEPDFRVDATSVAPYLSTMNIVDTFPEEVRDLAEAAQKNMASQQSAQQSLPGGENEIITLGTGSALPSKYRNVSSTLLRVPNVGSYLLDCGENTLGQLSRLYTTQELQEVLKDLKMIWISHMHADHHLGTAAVIKAWYEAVHGPLSNSTAAEPLDSADPVSVLSKPGKLFVVSETAMTQWLNEYASVENYGFHHLIPIEAYTRSKGEQTVLRYNGKEVGFENVSSKIAEAMKSATGLSDLKVCNVPHCNGARGLALSFPDGFKLCYSGDTRPSQNLVNIGKGSTVLLHEATFDDDLLADAKAKRHSTTSEALGVGLAMDARRVVLTHFSQRYSKIPVMSDLGGKEIVLEETDASNLQPAAADDGAGPLPTLADPTIAAPATASSPQTGVKTSGGGDASKSRSPERKSPRAARSPLRQFGRDAHTVAKERDMKAIVAFDHMRVKVKDIEHLDKFTPAFIELYKNANDHLNVTDAERALRQERAKERKALQKENNKKARTK